MTVEQENHIEYVELAFADIVDDGVNRDTKDICT